MALKLRKNRVPLPGCPLTECMALLGGAWTPNVIWYLSASPRRFGELRSDIPPISAKVLSARLLDALDHAVVGHRVDDHVWPHILHRLVVGAVDLQLIGLADLAQARFRL